MQVDGTQYLARDLAPGASKIDKYLRGFLVRCQLAASIRFWERGSRRNVAWSWLWAEAGTTLCGDRLRDGSQC